MTGIALARDELRAIANDIGAVTEALLALHDRELGAGRPPLRAFVALQMTVARCQLLNSPVLDLSPSTQAVLSDSASILSALECVLREAGR